MIEEALNQDALWYKKSGQDAFSKAIYTPSCNIKVRFQESMKLIKDKNGKDVVSQGIFICAKKIGLEDIIGYENTKYVLLNYKDSIDLDGNFEYRKVWV